MKIHKEENTVGIIQRTIKHFGVPVLKSSVKVSLKSHPDYPTFKSICDTLDEWHIENYPMKYGIDEIMEIKTPFIVHFNSSGGQIGFVTSKAENIITCYTSYEDKRKFGIKEFQENWSGAVILLKPDERSGEKDYRKKYQNEIIKNSVFFLTAIGLFLFMITTGLNLFFIGNPHIIKTLGFLYFTYILGISLSILLILHEFEVRLSVTEKLCHFNKATNCSTVLKDKASKLIGWLGWSDIGFIYFTSCLLFMSLGAETANYSVLTILSALALPYTTFSIYYQGFILKKWCPLCLGVQMILVMEFILLFSFVSHLNFTIRSILILITIFLFTGEKISNEMHNYKYLGLKKNPLIIKTLLFNQDHYDIPVNGFGLLFGHTHAAIKITAFLSLNCSHCAKAFEKIKDVLNSEIDVLFNLILVTSNMNLLNTLYHLNKQNMNNEALTLLDKWFNIDTYPKNKPSEELCIPEENDVSSDVNDENLKLYKACNVIGTPTFLINGYLLPHQYDIDDLKYFSEVFKQIEVVNNQRNLK